MEKHIVFTIHKMKGLCLLNAVINPQDSKKLLAKQPPQDSDQFLM